MTQEQARQFSRMTFQDILKERTITRAAERIIERSKTLRRNRERQAANDRRSA